MNETLILAACVIVAVVVLVGWALLFGLRLPWDKPFCQARSGHLGLQCARRHHKGHHRAHDGYGRTWTWR